MKIDTEKLSDDNIGDVYNYSPQINNPVPYQPEDNEMFKSSNFKLNIKEDFVSDNNIYENELILDNNNTEVEKKFYERRRKKCKI